VTDTLRISRPADGVVLLTLNRPQVMNAIDMALFGELTAALGDFELDTEARAIVVTGSGERAFSAGFDIHEMAGFDPAAMKAAFTKRDRLFWQVANHAKPIIAALNGATFGAGALMAAAADIRLGSPSLRFKITASSYGAANATWSLPPIVGVAKAKEILFTGRVVEAAEALEIGLINQLVTDGPVADAAVAMAAMIAANPEDGVQGIKQLVNGLAGRSHQAGYEAEFDWMIEHMKAAGSSGAEVFSGFLGKKTAQERAPSS
jgi:enoyl-CoA hydratase/carnithine racemase